MRQPRRRPRAADSLYRALLESSPTATIVIDEVGDRLVLVNSAAGHLLGYEQDELLAIEPTALVVPSDGPRFEAAARQLRACGAWRGEWTLRCKDGSTVVTDVSAVRLVADERTFWQVQFLDIAARANTEQALQEQAARLHTVVASVPVILFALDRDGRFTLSEGRGLDALGLIPGQIVGRSVFEVYAGEPGILEHARRALAGETFTCTDEITAHGRVYEVRWGPILAADSRVDGAIGVATDMTDQARVEAALRDRERRYRELIQGVDAIIWEAEAETWRFTFVSERAEDVLGYPAAQWLSEPTFWTDHIHPDDRAAAVELCVHATGQGRDHVFEYRAIAADGRVVWIRDIVYVIRDDEGKPRQLRGLMIDVTSRKMAEQLSIERARLEGALLAARTAQHELNNQLAATVGYAEMLADDSGLPRPVRDLARQALEGAERAVSSLQRLAQITRLEEVDQGGPGTVLDLGRSTHRA